MAKNKITRRQRQKVFRRQKLRSQKIRRGKKHGRNTSKKSSSRSSKKSSSSSRSSNKSSSSRSSNRSYQGKYVPGTNFRQDSDVDDETYLTRMGL